MSDYGPFPALVQSVWDGDTVHLDVDQGFGTHQTSLRCRVLGINAPELSADGGKAARDYAETLLPVGAQVTVTSKRWDAYGGRYDGAITLPDGRDFGAAMIAAGHAEKYPAT